MFAMIVQFISSSTAKYVVIFVIVAGLFGGGFYVEHLITSNNALKTQVQQAQADAIKTASEHQHIINALDNAVADGIKRSNDANQIKQSIQNAKNSTDCSRSAAINAALTGLRDRSKPVGNTSSKRVANVHAGTIGASNH